MDPQERLFIQSCWEVFEDAGYTREQLGVQYNRRIGVFAGITKTGFDLYGPDLWKQGKQVFPYTSFSSLANRISYLLNLQGPSMPIDTMCSSSLTAIHEACEHIHHGECEMAIAGGVNLYLHSSNYVGLSKLQMLSKDGQCKSFGQGGNGFVPGEGVGVVLLKRLSQAIQDKDRIYAVIRGTSINHGGKTNGYTVPNPIAQGDLIRAALDKAGVDARTVSYIEAHGTGTELGDPIEITGLAQAFRKDTQETQFCAMGSVKSNIGHLESAAGIAGLTKVLLQMKHGQLVPSLHSGVLNPNIDFGSSPFVVQQELSEWKRPVIEINGEVREYPRIAGISSFGAGGSNAHVVIEEYVERDREQSPIAITPENPAIIVLSAKSEERLKEYAKRLFAAIHEKQFTESDLGDIAYTLQAGREAMEERLAIIVTTISELEDKLKGFVEGRDDIEDLYRGQVKRNKGTLGVFAADEELKEAVGKWIERKKYEKLADLWVKGLVVDWKRLYGDDSPRRISLPTYPFARERYWIPKTDASIIHRESGGGVRGQVLHPLLHENTSDFSEQRFSSTFTGEEFFLSDHVVQGQKVLPGVAYLELARSAVEHAAGALQDEQTGIRLRNVVWARPIAVNGRAVHVDIALYLEESGEIVYEIYSRVEGNGAEPVVNSQGVATLNRVEQAPALDIKAIRSRCNRIALTPGRCYEAYKAMGIDYGAGHRGIKAVYSGEGQVLAELALPVAVSDTKDQYVLHPGMLDSALQASIGLMMGSAEPTASGATLKPALPFALDELEVYDRCTSLMWVFIRYSNDNKSGGTVQKLDIDVCDEQGKVCVRMRGFSSRVLEGDLQKNTAYAESAVEPPVGNILLTPVWDAVPVEKGQVFPVQTDRMVIVGGTEDNRNAIQQLYTKACVLEIQSTDTIEAIVRKLEAYGFDHILWIAPDHSLESIAEDAVIEEQNEGVLAFFRLIKALLRLNYGAKDLCWTVVTTRSQAVYREEVMNPTHASLSGLIGSMAKEYPNWKTGLIDVEADGDWPISDIFTLPSDSQGNGWAYRNGEWYRQTLVPVDLLQPDRSLYRPGGVYVVIGGAGGIGEVWSEYMIRTYQANIIWIGRREKDESIQAKLDRLSLIGPAPLYISADATDRQALQRAHEEIKEHHAEIHGVIHSAIGVLDQSLANMEEDRFKAGLSAKVDVSVRLAQVFQKEPLDFVLFFSSLNAFIKAAGQSNYAAGCTFKDAFAQQLSREWPCAVKVMNWGYWGSVGIVSSKEYQDRMSQAGIGSIEAPEAMEALETLLSGPMDQLAFLKTTKPFIMEGVSVGEVIAVNPQALFANFPECSGVHIQKLGS
jgi:polyketide synthase PksM